MNTVRTASRRVLITALAFALSGLAAASTARAIELGDPAPELQIAKWVKGEPVKEFEKGKVYVVEFWATWCPPCRTSIPHLTEMQKKYEDKVVFIGVSDEDAETVAPFVDKMGEQMAYRVAIDDAEGTGGAYMQPFQVRGIPHAFVVDGEGKLVWHCHPMDKLDAVLDDVVAGKFDVAAAKKRGAAEKAEQAAMQKLMPQLEQYMEVVTAEAPDEAKAKEMGAKLAPGLAKIPQLANRFAWVVLTEENVKFRDTALALAVAKGAVDATAGADAAILDTYARALHDTGDLKAALEQQKLAVEAAKDEQMKAELQATLEKYEGEAKEAK
jgi:thiol-disulfide isomerase/thioredoxin